ncbi:MAG: ketoacyl-ACP synthase III [Gammaproteobacteria bacterium]|nr:ketoacyl-ACP synthase III [Gammaproteobacteria bacterium]
MSGTGSYLPERILTNAELEKMVDTTDEWITSRSGISARHIAAVDQTTADMGSIAAQRALEAAQLTPEKIDLIIVATCTPDKLFPSTACLIQARLACKNAAAFDLSAACSGFIYALSVADQYIRAGNAQHILVIGSEVLSRVTDWQDRGTCVLFGDGAGAVVVSATPEPGIIATRLHAMGEHADILSLDNATLTHETCKIKMQGREVFKLAVNNFSDLISDTLIANQIKLSELNWLIPHQANMRIIESLANKLQLPLEQVIITLQEQGNTSAASIPLALDAAVRDGRIKKGQLILMAAFGGGITWGSALIRW